MGLAETVQLGVDIVLGTSGSFHGVTSELNSVEAAATRGVSATSVLGRGFGTAQKAAANFGGSLNHAKHAVGDLLTGPLGVLGLAGGVGGVGLAFEHIISHTNDFAFSVEKLTNLTGGSAESMSTLLAVFEKFNISAERTGMIVGFAEKTLGNLAKTSAKGTSKLIEIDKAYGLHLVDTHGKLVNFENELKQVANVYTSSIDPARKAALAAQLFGRGYADLVPILALGSKGITEAEQAAKDLGLTLTAQNATDLRDYREALRETGDAIGGLELQLGLALVPAIKDVSIAITNFLRHGGREQMVSFFKGLISAGRDVAGVITGTVIPTLQGLASAAKTAWNGIPPEIRDLLVKGFIANKTIKFLFGFDPIKFVTSGIESALSKALGNGLGSALASAGIGKLFVQPVFVTNPGFGLPGALGGAAEGAAVGEGAAAVGVAEGAAGLGLGTIAAGVAAGTAVAALGIMGLGWLITATSSPAQLANAAANATNNQKYLRTFGRQGFAPGMEPPSNAFQHTAQQITSGFTTFAGKLRDDLNGPADILRGAAAEFKGAVTRLAHPKSQADLVSAFRETAKLLTHGRGTAKDTVDAINSMKKQLGHVHDPKLRAEFAADIKKVEGLLPGRQFAQRELDKANAILKSHESGNQKIKDLEAVEKALKDRGLPHAADRIRDKIEQAKREQKAAQRATTEAIKDKDLSVAVTVNTDVSVSTRQVLSAHRTYVLAGNTNLRNSVGVN